MVDDGLDYHPLFASIYNLKGSSKKYKITYKANYKTLRGE